MIWQYGSYTETWLVNEEGEIIETIITSQFDQAAHLVSTGKRYFSIEAAKRAAEARQKGLDKNGLS